MLKQVRIIKPDVEGFEVSFGYLIDEENVIFFDNNQVWLTQVQHKEEDLFEVVDYRYVLLGDQIRTDYPFELYVQRLVKHLKNTSIFSYIIQKYLYDDQDFDWKITNI